MRHGYSFVFIFFLSRLTEPFFVVGYYKSCIPAFTVVSFKYQMLNSGFCIENPRVPVPAPRVTILGRGIISQEALLKMRGFFDFWCRYNHFQILNAFIDSCRHCSASCAFKRFIVVKLALISHQLFYPGSHHFRPNFIALLIWVKQVWHQPGFYLAFII